MRRIAVIAIKDLRVQLRDRTGMIAMLLVPLLLAIVLGMAFGSFGGSHSGLHVLIVDQDGSPQGGRAISAALGAPGLQSLLIAEASTDLAAARASVDQGLGVAVVIPPGVGAAMTGSTPGSASIEVYGNPTQSIAAGVVRSVVDGILARLNGATAAGRVAAATLVGGGLLAADDPRLGTIAAAAAVAAAGSDTGVPILSAGATPDSGGVDYGKVVGPSFAVLFLMFTMSAGSRKMLEERESGTLARLLVSPSRRIEILLGKGVGMYLVGALQMSLLLVATTLIFSISWGSVPALVVLTAALVFTATAWGLLLAGLARTPAQANQAGTALTIVFGIIAGNFVPRTFLPTSLQNLSLATPNGLGLEGYQHLVGGDGFASIIPYVVALLATGVMVFAVGLVASHRRLGTA